MAGVLLAWMLLARLCVVSGARGLGVLWASSWGGVVLGALWARGGCWCSPPLVGVWVVSRERPCLREVCGWVGDMEGVALLE